MPIDKFDRLQAHLESLDEMIARAELDGDNDLLEAIEADLDTRVKLARRLLNDLDKKED